MRAVLVAAAVACGLQVHAQRMPEPKFSAQGWLLLPVVLDNPMFNTLTEVQGQLEAAVQVPLWKGLGVGAGAKLGFFGLEERALSLVTTQGEVTRSVFYGKVQFERYLGSKVYLEVFAKAGTAQWQWNCRTCTANERQQALHWGGGSALFLHATDNLAFGVLVGYESDRADLAPRVIGLDQFPGHASDPRPYRFFTVGLGFSTRFLPTKGDDMW